jgi:hypothetical protein
MANDITKSNIAHERLAELYESKKKKIELKGNNDSLSERQIKQKKYYSLKMTYHRSVLFHQRLSNKILSKKIKNRIYKNVKNYLFK